MRTPPAISDGDFEQLGLLVDKLDNFAAGAVLPLPAHIHKEALTGCVQDARDELRAWLIGKGFNPWSAS
jgi:hypothetical protein